MHRWCFPENWLVSVYQTLEPERTLFWGDGNGPCGLHTCSSDAKCTRQLSVTVYSEWRLPHGKEEFSSFSKIPMSPTRFHEPVVLTESLESGDVWLSPSVAARGAGGGLQRMALGCLSSPEAPESCHTCGPPAAIGTCSGNVNHSLESRGGSVRICSQFTSAPREGSTS